MYILKKDENDFLEEQDLYYFFNVLKVYLSEYCESALIEYKLLVIAKELIRVYLLKKYDKEKSKDIFDMICR